MSKQNMRQEGAAVVGQPYADDIQRGMNLYLNKLNAFYIELVEAGGDAQKENEILAKVSDWIDRTAAYAHSKAPYEFFSFFEAVVCQPISKLSCDERFERRKQFFKNVSELLKSSIESRQHILQDIGVTDGVAESIDPFLETYEHIVTYEAEFPLHSSNILNSSEKLEEYSAYVYQKLYEVSGTDKARQCAHYLAANGSSPVGLVGSPKAPNYNVLYATLRDRARDIFRDGRPEDALKNNKLFLGSALDVVLDFIDKNGEKCHTAATKIQSIAHERQEKSTKIEVEKETVTPDLKNVLFQFLNLDEDNMLDTHNLHMLAGKVGSNLTFQETSADFFLCLSILTYGFSGYIRGSDLECKEHPENIEKSAVFVVLNYLMFALTTAPYNFRVKRVVGEDEKILEKRGQKKKDEVTPVSIAREASLKAFSGIVSSLPSALHSANFPPKRVTTASEWRTKIKLLGKIDSAATAEEKSRVLNSLDQVNDIEADLKSVNQGARARYVSFSLRNLLCRIIAWLFKGRHERVMQQREDAVGPAIQRLRRDCMTNPTKRGYQSALERTRESFSARQSAFNQCRFFKVRQTESAAEVSRVFASAIAAA